MKAVKLAGIGELAVSEAAEPVIKDEKQVLLKVDAVGVCGSDVHYYKQGKIGSEAVKYPFIVGHECAATVKELGRAVARIKVGDRVVVDPAISCGECSQCRAGRKNTCRNLKYLGCPGQIEGCLCEYIVMPEENCYVSEKLTAGQAVLCEPLAIAVYAVERAAVNKDSDVAILGAGPIGLSVLLCSGLKTEKIYVTDRVRERIEAAKNNGALWAGNPDREDIVREILKLKPEGADVVFECAGRQQTIDQAMEILKPGGRLMLIGIPEEDKIHLDIHKMRRKEITIVNVRRQNDCTQKAIDLISKGLVNADFMLTHSFKPEQAADAFEMVAGYRDGVIKAVIEF